MRLDNDVTAPELGAPLDHTARKLGLVKSEARKGDIDPVLLDLGLGLYARQFTTSNRGEKWRLARGQKTVAYEIDSLPPSSDCGRTLRRHADTQTSYDLSCSPFSDTPRRT